jgi:hypothetical protein
MSASRHFDGVSGCRLVGELGGLGQCPELAELRRELLVQRLQSRFGI